MDPLLIPGHHKKDDVCTTRARYRQGRKETAVKVYTISKESVYLVIHGVPAVNLASELQATCEQYGRVKQCRVLKDYPTEDFTEVFLIQYQNLASARFAKKKLDDRTFYGGSLHVFYAPEFETIQDTRKKLAWRQAQVASKTNQDDVQLIGAAPSTDQVEPAHEAVSSEHKTVSYVWAGKEYVVGPSTADEFSNDQKSNASLSMISSTHSNSSRKQSTVSCSSKPAFLPRTLTRTLKTKDVCGFIQSDSQQRIPFNNTQDTFLSSGETNSLNSYDNTIASIRKRLSNFGTPNVEVLIKRKKM